MYHVRFKDRYTLLSPGVTRTGDNVTLLIVYLRGFRYAFCLVTARLMLQARRPSNVMTRKSPRAIAAFILLLIGLVPGSLQGIANAQQASFTCTEIVGFSQTMQWYFAGFPQATGNPGGWQLRWQGAASIDAWADPNYSGWQPAYQVNSCSSGGNPDRVLLNISGDYNSDVNWWVQQISAAITNIRNKYPSQRQIILQPVVGGPNNGQCASGDASNPINRASYNHPYIDQAIARLVAGGVVAGASPEVRTCADYADWVGHLTDSAKGPIAVTIGQWYASVGTASPPPPNTATPTRTPAPAGSPSPTPVPPTSAVVNFNDLTNANRALSGQYPGGLIDWGTNAWYLSGPYGAFQTNSIGFNGAGPISATFTFLAPRRLVQLDAYNGGSTNSTVSLSCNGQLSTQVTVTPRTLMSVPMGWAGTCSTVTVGSSNGWSTNFDNLVIDSGGTASATSVPTSTPTRTPTALPTNTPTGPTPTPGSAGTASSITAIFDDLSNPNRPLSGEYPSGVVDWGTNAWYLSGPFGQMRTQSIGFNGSGPTSASLRLISPRRLARVDAFNGGSGSSTVTLACAGQQTVQVSLASGQFLTISTNWTGTCSTVTVGSTNGWHVNFDNLVFDGGSTLQGAVFDDLPNPNRPLSGQYPNGAIDWDINRWYLSGPWGAMRTNSVGFNGAGPTSASFTFLTPRKLRQLEAYNGGSASTTVTISCAGQPTVTVVLAPRELRTIQTGWAGTCTTVTLGSTNGWDTNFDTILYE
jgi:hypothetical protein